MSYPAYFFRGMLVGVAIAIPVGPVMLLILNRTLNHGKRYGLASGLGVSTAEFIYSVLAGLGVSFIMDFMLHYRLFFELFGCGLLFCFGLAMYRTKPEEEKRKISPQHLISTYFTMMAITLAHPLLFVSLLALYAGFGVFDASDGIANVLCLSGGLFCASALWWVILVANVSFFMKKLFERNITLINRVCGVIIMCCVPLVPIITRLKFWR